VPTRAHPETIAADDEQERTSILLLLEECVRLYDGELRMEDFLARRPPQPRASIGTTQSPDARRRR
jgi:hypothetical protein